MLFRVNMEDESAVLDDDIPEWIALPIARTEISQEESISLDYDESNGTRNGTTNIVSSMPLVDENNNISENIHNVIYSNLHFVSESQQNENIHDQLTAYFQSTPAV